MMTLTRAKIPELWKWIDLLLVGILVWLPQQTQAQLFYTAQSPTAFDATKSDDDILVIKEEDQFWGFFPQVTSDMKDVGFIYHTATFYDERAYAPIARELAKSGYPAFILDVPLSLAFLTPFRADLVIRNYPDIKAWVVGGHGIGGAVASCYAQRRNMDGLALFSSYPFPLFNNFKRTDIEAISLWGSLDGITSRQQWEDGKLALPDDALFIEIEGANHSNMAWLSSTVCNDNVGTISRNDQQSIVNTQLRLLMNRVQQKVNEAEMEKEPEEEDDDDDDDH